MDDVGARKEIMNATMTYIYNHRSIKGGARGAHPVKITHLTR